MGPLAPLVRIGQLDLLERVGRGAMGEVWSARHAGAGQADTVVALKLFTSHSATDDSIRATFQRKLQAIAALDRARIVRIYDHGRVNAEEAGASEGLFRDGTPYLVMEYPPGGTPGRRHARRAARVPLGRAPRARPGHPTLHFAACPDRSHAAS
jgi:serine/threonine protein kinase